MLRTDYTNDILDSSKNTERVYNIKNASGQIVEENIRIEDITEYTQEGSKFGANDINATNQKVNELDGNLNGFRFGIDGDGNYGYYKADDSFAPFKSISDNLKNFLNYFFVKDYGFGRMFFVQSDKTITARIDKDTTRYVNINTREKYIITNRNSGGSNGYYFITTDVNFLNKLEHNTGHSVVGTSDTFTTSSGEKLYSFIITSRWGGAQVQVLVNNNIIWTIKDVIDTNKVTSIQECVDLIYEILTTKDYDDFLINFI